MKKNEKRSIILRISILVISFFMLGILLGVLTCSVSKSGNRTKQTTDNTNVEDDVTEVEVIEVEENKTVSLFSWYFELTNQPLFHPLSQPLKEYGINRIYQNISARNIQEPEMAIMIQNLADIGIETVALTGDKSWVTDGLDEYCKIVEQIHEYNQQVPKECNVKSIALDVEIHGLPEWKEDRETLFADYITLMKEAKEYAKSYGLKVIQIVPTMYDEIDEELFEIFVQECCDELSIMNYNRKSAEKAILREVEICNTYNVPIETIFETMPLSKEHEVTEEMTYFYSGIEALEQDADELKESYGPALGIAYHHFTTFYEIATGQKIGEIHYKEITTEEGMNPGNMVLYGDDGSRILATPYWPRLRKNKEEYCWMAVGVEEEVQYCIDYFDFYDETTISESEVFETKDGDTKLHMDLEKEEE